MTSKWMGPKTIDEWDRCNMSAVSVLWFKKPYCGWDFVGKVFRCIYVFYVQLISAWCNVHE
jgi:hypothetical protein